MTKIDKEKSVVYSNYSDPVNLCERGTFVDDFDYPDSYFEGTLCGIRANAEKPFMVRHGNWYKYFVPESTKVLEEPKKLRPYKTLKEFPGGVGSVLTYRNKSNPSVQILTSIQSIITQDNYLVSICMYGLRYSPLRLLTDYEYLNAKGDAWLPFGVEE